MAQLELLASPPGTGKTYHCIEVFRQEILKTKSGIDSRSFFILPSREHADRIQHLVLRKELPGLFNAHILTINDLTSKLLGVSSSLHPSDVLRRSLIRRILSDPETELPFFQGIRDTDGFSELLTDIIKEFKSSLLSVRDFETRCQKLLKNKAFRSKFRDFSVLFKSYEAELERLGLNEPEDDIARLFSGASRERAELMIFDGFYHFNGAQKKLIEYVSRVSARTIVTLTLPGPKQLRDESRKSVFHYPQRTRAFLEGIGFFSKRWDPEKNRRTSRADLEHLERHLFFSEPPAFKTAPPSLKILEGSGARNEVEMIAREIRALYRDTRNPLHYSDICVILREISGYEEVIRSIFQRFDIPVHVHEREKLIRQGFAAVLHRFLGLEQDGWKKDTVAMILKTSFFNRLAPPEDIAQLERAGFLAETSAAWRELADSKKVSSAARQALLYLLDRHAQLSGAESASAFCASLENFIAENIETEEGIESQALLAMKTIVRSAREHYSDTSRVFNAKELMDELRGSIEAALFSVKPAGKNRVQVYDAVMAMPKEYKVVFMAGLLEKSFPKAVTEDALFKDFERAEINQKGELLEERLGRLSGERYFFYMAACRAKEKLYFSYPLYQADGRSTLPSFFVEEVKKTFPKISIVRTALSEVLPPPSVWETEEDSKEGISAALFQPENRHWAASPGFGQLLNSALTDGVFREILATGFKKNAARISDPEARKILAERNKFSASRLEKYVNCAFQYFATYQLKLAEPPEGVENREMGDLLHQILEEYFKRLSEEDLKSAEFWSSPKKITAQLESSLEAKLSSEAFSYLPEYRRRLCRETLRKAIRNFAKQECELRLKRPFVPRFFELDFGSGKKNAYPPLQWEHQSEKWEIEGRMDRVDMSSDDKALIIDYKLGGRDLSGKLKKGLEIQLPLYLIAGERALGWKLAGAELRSLKKGEKKGIYLEGEKSLGKGKNVSEWNEIISNASNAISDSLKRLKQADITIRPKSCKFCSYQAVCRFQKQELDDEE